jgi:cytochrome P450
VKCPADFDFFDPAVQSDPIEFFDVLRHQASVYKEPTTGAYMVTRAKDIRYVADHPELFSNYIDPSVFLVCQGLSLEEKDPEVAAIFRAKAWLIPHTLLLTDPPEHGRYRRLALEALSPKAVKKLTPFIEQQVDRYIKPFDSGETIDFVPVFCEHLPLSIVLRFIGAPDSDIDLINGWTHQFFSTEMGQSSREEYLKTVDAMCELYNYVARRVEAVRKQRDGSLLDDLMHAHEETGDVALTLEELISMFHVLLMAGHDTTRQTLANGMHMLTTLPQLFRQLQQHPEQIGSFVEEVIRLYPPATMTPRVTTEDTDVAGVKIPQGATIYLCWGSANRDEEVFADAAQFKCPNEAGKDHFGFGYGAHFCVGNRLARTTLSIAFSAFLTRYQSVLLNVPESELRYMPAINLRALLGLPIRCTLKN